MTIIFAKFPPAATHSPVLSHISFSDEAVTLQLPEGAYLESTTQGTQAMFDGQPCAIFRTLVDGAWRHFMTDPGIDPATGLHHPALAIDLALKPPTTED